jgi:hypothetical protein
MKKEHLPQKICLTCGLPYTWRKKWKKIGKKLNIAVNAAEERNEKSQLNISSSIISRVSTF